MIISLNVDKNGRIISAAFISPEGYQDGMVIVEHIPDGDITDYLYKNGQYIYDPKPAQPTPEPAPSLESRVSTVESDVAALTAAIEKGLAL